MTNWVRYYIVLSAVSLSGVLFSFAALLGHPENQLNWFTFPINLALLGYWATRVKKELDIQRKNRYSGDEEVAVPIKMTDK